MKKRDEMPDPLIPDIPDPIIHFPRMPHNVDRALWTVLEYAGSLSAAGALLAEYALIFSQKHPPTRKD